MAEAGQHDVFVSYAHKDRVWATDLVGNLHRLDLDVWWDRWEMVSGDLIGIRLQDGLAASRAVVAVVSRYSIESGWCEMELAAALTAAAKQGKRLIPVLLDDDVELPPFLAARLCVDFRHVASSGQYVQLMHQLADAVRGVASDRRPERGGPLVVPDTVGYRPEGPTHAELQVGGAGATFTTSSRTESCPPQGAARDLDQQVQALQRVRARAARTSPTRQSLPLKEDATPAGLTRALGAVGEALRERYVHGEVAAALAEEERRARSRNASLRIGLQVDDPEMVDLPWETLVLPGRAEPLALSDQVEFYRSVDRRTGAVSVPVPGPLRILAVVASPESGGGELLDYELELSRILDAVDPARSGRRAAYVRVLNWGSLAEIRAALERERFHVLHLSCHAKPGALILEDARGRADEVDARQFVEEALPPDRGLPLVVLAGCSTARTPEPRQAEHPRSSESAEEEAPDAGTSPAEGEAGEAGEAGEVQTGLARALLERGVPAVLAMTTSVTDHYATELAAEMYETLARAEHPYPLTALSQARRTLEKRRREQKDGDPRPGWPEWATPTLFLAGPPLPLFDRTGGDRQVPVEPEAVLDEGMVVRKVGEFVGRRTELRRLLGALRDPQQAGVLIHGIGGVGKSTLAAELLHHYGTRDRLVVPVAATSALTADAVLQTLRERLSIHCTTEGLPETDPLRGVVVALAEARVPWRERWQLIRQSVLPRHAMLMVVDNAEDLLTRTPADEAFQPSDPELAELLTAWTTASPRTRLLVTSRYPFALPHRAHKRLTPHHLGPLSWAETRKLIWRLEGLKALPPTDQHRAYTDVGGHPRALEYLDALLRGGPARFRDIAERMEAALEERGIHDPESWLAGVKGDLDTALAETITLAVDDVLLDTLLAQLDGVAGARRLLDGMAVYRVPVDRIGAAWQLSDLTAPPDVDPALGRRLRAVNALITEARAAGGRPEEFYGLAPEAVREYQMVYGELRQPPVDLDEEFGCALKRLLDLGLIAPAPAPQDELGTSPTGLTVHNWTADALCRRAHPDTIEAAHRRAAAYWQWRVNVWPQPATADITQLIEARHHHHQAGDVDRADTATQRVCLQLHTWGAWDWEQRLVEENLTWVPAHSRSAAAHTHQLGIIAQERGDYRQAEERYRASLTIKEDLGDRPGIATSYHQLGIIAQLKGDYRQAEERYRASLTIKEDLGNRPGIASSYHQLGIIAQLKGDYRQAEERYRASLTIREDLGDRPGIADSYHNLGTIAQERGDYQQAEDRYRASLTIKEELGDRPGIADSYHNLGAIAQERGDYQQAEDRYRASLTIKEELGDRPGIATSYHQLGIIAQLRGDYQQAEDRYRASLTIKEELGNRSSIANSYGQLGVLRTKQQRPAEGVPFSLQALAIQLDIGNPPGTTFYWLGRQRALLGDDAFRSILDGLMPDDAATAVMNTAQPQHDPPAPDGPPASEAPS